MAAWLSKVLNVLSPPDAAHEEVRRKLEAAQRARVKLWLEVGSPGRLTLLGTTVEQVRSADIIIAQPSVGGLTHPLTVGERLRLGFVHERKHYSGQTQCLGRITIPAGSVTSASDALLYAYRLAFPKQLQVEDRRKEPRANLLLDPAPEAQVYAPSLAGPVFGRILDISMSGSRIRTPLTIKGVAVGQEVFLKALLPEPVGLIDQPVEVVRLEADYRTGDHLISVRFVDRIPGLADLLRGRTTSVLAAARTA